LYIYQEKKLFAWKNTIHSSQYNFRFMPFFFLSIYECISAFSFFLKAEREREREKSVLSCIHNYLLHTQTKEKYFVYIWRSVSSSLNDNRNRYKHLFYRLSDVKKKKKECKRRRRHLYQRDDIYNLYIHSLSDRH